MGQICNLQFSFAALGRLQICPTTLREFVLILTPLSGQVPAGLLYSGLEPREGDLVIEDGQSSPALEFSPSGIE